MLVRCHHDPRAFFELVEPFLLLREAENAMPLGVARSFVQTATHDGLMFSVESGSDVVLAAVKSPHRQLLVTAGPECALRALATYLDAFALPVPGITGPSDSVDHFCRAWESLTDQRARLRMRLHLYAVRGDKLQREPMPDPAMRDQPARTKPTGAFRLAEESDVDVLEDWLHGFIEEATHERHADVRPRVRQMIGSRSIGLWDDAGPASMAAVTRRSDHGAHLSWVYTPPERRGHGYARAVVAELSARELKNRSFCTIYANRDHAPSNALYQRLGYAPIGDASDAVFERI